MLTASQSPRVEGRGNHRRGLKSAGANHRDGDRRLHQPRVGQVLPLDLVRPRRRLVPLAPRQLGKVSEEEVGAEGRLATGDQRVIGLREVLDGQVDTGRIARMREEAADRDVNGVDAGIDEPAADLHGFGDGVARGALAEEGHRVVVIAGC